MYIKNQAFNDEDTLLEMIFDFSLGEAEPLITELRNKIAQELERNETYVNYLATLDEEDRLEVETEEQDIRLAEALMAMFDSFRVEAQRFYGVKDGTSTLLYSVDLV